MGNFGSNDGGQAGDVNELILDHAVDFVKFIGHDPSDDEIGNFVKFIGHDPNGDEIGNCPNPFV
jgi:ribulose bisphosphate carboxylase small subunit